MRALKKGFTLVEVLISIIIFAFVTLSITALFSQVVRVSKKINYEYIAFNLAKNRIERLKNIDFGALPDASETDTSLNKNGTPDDDGEFLRSTSVTTNYNSDENLTKIEVSIAYIFLGKKTQTPTKITTVFVDM